MPVTSDIVRLKAYRAANPDLANLSDQEFARKVFEQTGELGDYANAGPLQRGIGEYSAFMQGLGEQAGKKVESGLRRYGFKPDDVGVTATTKAVKGLVSSAPETLAALGASMLFPRSRTIAGLATAGLTGSQVARTYADTGSKQSALSAGVSGVGQLAGGLAGAKVAGKLGGGALAKAGGALLGSTAGDVAGMAIDPQQLKENFGTKSDALAYGLMQLPFAALDVAHGLGESANAKREAKVASTKLPGQLDLVTLQKIPVASLSDDQAARLVALSREAASKEEANAAKVSMESMKPEDFMPESDVTLNEQAKLVKEGRKPLVALPRDLDAKRVPELEGLNSVEVGDQKLYFLPEVDANKVVSDYNAGVGKALGYGTNDPSTSGFALVLRGESGVEKLAVNVNPKNINDVATSLRSMAGPGDMVFKEPIVSLHESRKLAGNKAVEVAPQTLLDLNKVGETPFALSSTSVENNPNFKSWFGESKVVDELGKPKRVYHGTQSAFKAFDKKFRGSNYKVKSAKLGFFFTDSTSTANDYAGHHELFPGDGGNVVPVYLTLKNPFEVDLLGLPYDEDLYVNQIEEAKRRGHDGLILRNTNDALSKGKIVDYTKPGTVEVKTNEDKTEATFVVNGKVISYAELLPNGFWRTSTPGGTHGLVRDRRLEAVTKRVTDDYESTFRPEPIYGKSKNETVYIVFEPEQIKSAIGNKGTFDKTNPDLVASIAGKDFLRDRVFASVPEPESKIKGINVDSKGEPLYRATELAGHIATHIGDDLGGKFLRTFKDQKVTKDYATNWIRAQLLKSQLGQVKTQLERSVASGVQVTPADFVRAIDAGEKVDKAVLLRFLSDLIGDKSFRLFNLQPTGDLQIRGVTTPEGVFVNKAQNARSAFAAASHEFNHVAFHELKQANPHLYQQAVEYASGLGSDGRAALLKSVFDIVGVKGFDFDYASGRKFDPQAENFNEASAREFYAGLTEALAHDAFNTASRTNSKLNELFRALPQGVQDVLSRLLEKFRQYFSPNSGFRNSLPADVASELDRAYQKLLTFYSENKLAQQSAARQLERLGVFTYGEGLPDIALAKQQAASVEKIATQYSLSGLPGVGSVVELYDKYLFNPQYNAFVHPELQDGWLELHTTKSKERAVIYSYMEFLGQDGKQTLSREQAVVRTEKLIRQLTSKPEIAAKVSSVLEENTARRSAKQEKSSEVVTQRDLVSVREMKEKFGLSDEMAEFTQRLSQVTAKAAEQTLRFMQANDNVSLAKLVYSQLSSTHSIKQVKEGCTGLTRIGSDLGQKLFEKELLTSALTSARESTSGAQRSAELTARLQKAQVEASFLETQFNLKVDEVFGQDSFKPKFKKLLLDAAASLGRNRAEHQFTTKDAGYMPMTRRGRFLLWVYDGPANSAASSTKELKGFNTAEEARKYIEDKKIVHYDLKDKQDFERRAEFYNTPQLQRFADKTRKELAAIVEEYKKTAIGVDGLGNVGKLLDDLVENFRPVDEELKQLISVKGDKFAQRRWNTPGFDKKDYLPNLFEYLQYKTHQAQRRLTINEYQLQMLQPAIQSNPEKLKYMGDELKYFTTPQAEWGKVREGIFYYYLGLSPRQFFLNSTQLFLNAIPAAVKMGHGINAYPDTIKALALVAQHTATGTTGNKVFDGLLKQAELDGVIMPNALENFVPELDEVQSSLDNISTWVDGESKLGYEVKQVAGDMSRGLRTALRSLGVAGEKINRRTSFLMSLLQSERAGVKDVKEMYRKASLFTDHVNFVGDKSNRVGLIKSMQGNQAHGAILTITAMQSFSLNHASQLAAYAKTLKTSRDKAALGVAMLHLGLMAGTLGLPFVRNGLALIGSVTDEDPEQYLRRKGIETASKYFNVSEQAGGTITSLAMDGLPSVLGIDAGSSLGLGDMLFRFQADRVPTLFDLVGPGGGIVSNLGKAAREISNDPSDVSSYVNAIRTGGPTGAKYIARLTDMAFDNKYYNGAGEVKLDDLNKVDTASILLGFTPARATAMQKQSVSVMKAGQAYSSKRSAVVTKIAQRLAEYDRTGDQTKATEAKELLNNFLEENPFVNASELISSISDAKTKKSTVVLGAPSANVYKQFEATRSAYPGTEYPVSNQTQSLSDEIRVALSVGRLDVLAQKLSALPKQSQKAGLYDSLIQAGYNPALVQRALSGDTKALELLLQPGE